MHVATGDWERQANVKDFSAVESQTMSSDQEEFSSPSDDARAIFKELLFMKMFHLLLVGVLLTGVLGLWGCTHQQTGAISTKIRDLEARYAKLEEDYRVLQTANEQGKKRLAQSEAQRLILEQQKGDLTNQLAASAGQRDELRKQISARTVERDTAQTNLAQFSKELQALVGRVESALNSTPNAPSLTVVPVSRRND